MGIHDQRRTSNDAMSGPSSQHRPNRDELKGWLLLLLKDGLTHGWELRRQLSNRNLNVDPSAVYRTLRILEEEGLVASKWTKSTEGPRKRTYRITLNGLGALEEHAATVKAARDIHNAFLGIYEGRETP